MAAAPDSFRPDTPGQLAGAPGPADDATVIAESVLDPEAVASGDPAMIIFNPRTGAYMGGRTTYLGESPRNYSGEAVVKLAIVNRIGQLP